MYSVFIAMLSSNSSCLHTVYYTLIINAILLLSQPVVTYYNELPYDTWFTNLLILKVLCYCSSATDAQIRISESSMRNGFGLKYLHKFFNLPFLALQRDTLLRQLETNRHETMLTNDELDVYLEADDSNYDRFVHLLSG